MMAAKSTAKKVTQRKPAKKEEAKLENMSANENDISTLESEINAPEFETPVEVETPVKAVTPGAKQLIKDEDFDRMAKEFGASLKARPKVTIRIPKNQLNPKDVFVVCHLNGYMFQIARDETVQVPDVIAAILEEGGYL